MKKNFLATCIATLLLFGLTSLGHAKDMDQSLHSNFSQYMISQFNEYPTVCSDNARADEYVEWMCTYHDGTEGGHLAFIDTWTQVVNSDVICENYNVYEASTWKYVLFPDTNTVNFYAKLYGFEEGAMLLTYIPNDPERGIMIGYAPSLDINFASGDVYQNEVINSYRTEPCN